MQPSTASFAALSFVRYEAQTASHPQPHCDAQTLDNCQSSNALCRCICSDVASAQISKRSRAQMLSLPKEGRANLPNGYRTSNCTRIGTDLSREGALHALESREWCRFCWHRVWSRADGTCSLTECICGLFLVVLFGCLGSLLPAYYIVVDATYVQQPAANAGMRK